MILITLYSLHLCIRLFCNKKVAICIEAVPVCLPYLLATVNQISPTVEAPHTKKPCILFIQLETRTTYCSIINTTIFHFKFVSIKLLCRHSDNTLSNDRYFL